MRASVTTALAAAAFLLTPALTAAAAVITRSPPASKQTVAVGAHVIYSYNGSTVPTALHQLVDQGKVGGVILFGANVNNNTPQAMQELQTTWAKSASYNGVPLLIVTDQEGGEVRRLPGGPTESEKQIGASSNPSQAATQAGQQAAAILRTYQNNGNLAPVCDVFRKPGDFDDQYQRSYSNNATIAAECTSAFVTAQQGAGPLATAKHFPGLGAATASEDTDEEPVTLHQSYQDIMKIDEPPFVAAIKAGVQMIMASWAYYPAFDAKYPAGLSAKWIQQELRGRLGFKGVTITDAIEAGGLTHFGNNDGYRAILATTAGMDIILAAALDPQQGSGIVDSLTAALNNGTLDATKFNQATQRILAMRKSIH